MYSLVLTLPGFALAEENDAPGSNSINDIVSVSPDGQDGADTSAESGGESSGTGGDGSGTGGDGSGAGGSGGSGAGSEGAGSGSDTGNGSEGNGSGGGGGADAVGGDEPLFSALSDDMTIQPFASPTSSDLTDFVSAVSIFDMSQTPPLQISPPTSPPPVMYRGQTYQFQITFSETAALQMAYDTNYTPPALTYQLPSNLVIQNNVGPLPIYSPANGTAIIGWYTIDTGGSLQMWFENVDRFGNPTPGGVNFIDYYANVSVTLDIFAQLTGDSPFVFGPDVTVPFDPQEPPPSLTMHKVSQYDPRAQTIKYTITITALSGAITDIVLDDTPSVNGDTPINNPIATNAFSGFSYTVTSGGTPGPATSMDVNWVDDPAEFDYSFVSSPGVPLVLDPGDFITVTYTLDLPTLIDNNNTASTDSLYGNNDQYYDFTVQNLATVTGTVDDGSDDTVGPVSATTTDNVVRALLLQKSGVYYGNDPSDPTKSFITWTVTVGDGESIDLSGGTIIDTLQPPNMYLPTDNSQISITFYDDNETPIYTGNATDFDNTPGATYPNLFTTLSTTSFQFILPASGDFPATGTPTDIYQVVITFSTDVPPPVLGATSIDYRNIVTFQLTPDDPVFTATGDVPVVAGAIVVDKQTSGICGSPATGYWVDYTTDITIPGGLQGAPLYLFDDLAIFNPSWAILEYTPNVPANLKITAVGAEITPDNQLIYSAPMQYTQGDSWIIYFGTTDWPADVSADNNDASWQFNYPVTITISYRINLANADIAIMQNGDPGDFLSNAMYLINSVGTPVIYGSAGEINYIGAYNVNDYWPIYKTGAPTAGNPALFNYQVLINGNYSPMRGSPLMQAGAAPVYSDTFQAGLTYVPGTFYIVDTTATSLGTPTYYLPPAGYPVVSGNSFSVGLSLSGWSEVLGTYPAGTPSPAPADWFYSYNDFQVNYQLLLTTNLDTQRSLTNTAGIRLDAGAIPPTCFFQGPCSVTYIPKRVAKSMEPIAPGANIFDVQIVINADGQYTFNDGLNPAPNPIVAKDTLSNLMVYTETIEYFTQTKVNGVWDGNWIPVTTALTFNTGAPWSVTVVSPTEIDFIVPNNMPAMVEYQALVTLPAGTAGNLSNSVSIFARSGSSTTNNYSVTNQTVGATAGTLDLRVFKKGEYGHNLPGAEFELYVTNLDGGPPYNPPGSLTDDMLLTGAGGAILNFGLIDTQTTDPNGTALFGQSDPLLDQWIENTYDLLYVLVETGVPPNYSQANEYTFFTLNPLMPPSLTNSLNALLAPELNAGQSVSQVSDFISIINTFDGVPETLRVHKTFSGLSDAQILFYLSGFYIIISDANGDPLEKYTLSQALDPLGITLPGITAGTYYITEGNAGAPGYTLTTTPSMPIRVDVAVSDLEREVLIRVNNNYSQPTPTPPPGDSGASGAAGAKTGDAFSLSLYIFLLALSLACIWLFAGRLFSARSNLRKR